MAISTYAELQTAVANFLHRADLTSRIPEFITLAEARINRKLKIYETETSADVSLLSGTRTAALPTGFRGVKRFYLDTSPITILTYMTPQDYWARYTSTNTGKPTVYTIEGSNFVFGAIPDAAYTGKLLFVKALDALATSAHGVFTANPDLYLYGSLCAAESYLKNDKRLPMWKVMFDEIIGELDAQDMSKRGQMAIRDDYNPQ